MSYIQILSTVVLIIGMLESADSQSLACPAVRTSSGWLDLFPLPCKKHTECRSVMGKQHLCCKGFCTKGIALQQRTNDQKGSVASSTSTSTSTTTTSTTTTTTTTTTPSTTSSTTTTTTTTTTTPRPTTQPPLPFLQLLPIQTSRPATNQKAAKTNAGKAQKLVCLKGQTPLLLFPIPCENTAQCQSSSGADQVCCDRRCVKGVPPPRPKPSPRNHQRVIPRECPAAPLGELLFEVQSCKTDMDCWPRVCCPDGTRSYCRTARARLDLVPVASQINGPVRMLEQYLQCTAPPKQDLFPQRCSSSVDCFPNLCCAEGGKKHCRPPQRSLLAFLAGVTQSVGSTLGRLRFGPAQNNNV